jgi:nucleotide-binding universal stress UspA family protein
MHLAGMCDATVHTMSIGGGVAQSDLRDAVEAEEQRLGTSARVNVHAEAVPEDAEGALRTIEEYVEENRVELVVSGPRPGREPDYTDTDRWRHALAERLDCSIFMVDACGNPGDVNRVLVPTGLSASSVNTLKHAVGVANCYEASIVLLHVLEASPYVALTPMDRLSLGATTLSEHRAHRRLHRLIKEAGAGEVTVHPRIAFGTPVDQIARFVDEDEADLLLLSARGGVSHPDQSLSPVADRLLRRITSPFFLVRSTDASLLPVEDETDTGSQGSEENESSISSSG